MLKKFSIAIVVTVYALSSACLSPRPWWDREMENWIGAPVEEFEAAWGPPLRTIIGDNDNPVYVYESHIVRDSMDDKLRDPSQRVSDQIPGAAPQVEEFDCTMYFEIANNVVADAWHDGAGCQVVIRRLEQQPAS